MGWAWTCGIINIKYTLQNFLKRLFLFLEEGKILFLLYDNSKLEYFKRPRIQKFWSVPQFLGVLKTIKHNRNND